jgi:RNA recognition motif-containing protein
MDFLFHKTGPSKGKPRGYAFVEYSSPDEALKALGCAHDKLLRGRKLAVTFAHQAPLDQVVTGSHINGHKSKKGVTEAGRPTTLSILKGGVGGKGDGTKDKIALMEAKLRQMEHSSQGMSTPLRHHSLPTKPMTQQPAVFQGNTRLTKPHINECTASLPIRSALLKQELPSGQVFSGGTATHSSAPRNTALVGVRLKRLKDRRELASPAISVVGDSVVNQT